MSKRIIIGLDETEYSKTALQIAFRRAKEYGSELVGVISVDTDKIAKQVGPTPVGGIHMAQKSAEKMVNTAYATAEKLKEEFESLCKKKKIKHVCHIKQGEPWEELIEEAKIADLLIVGQKIDLQIGIEDDPEDVLEHILRSSVCPVLAVTEDTLIPENVLIAFDGSIQASNVLREFAHLNIKQPKFFKRVVILNVNSNVEVGMKLLKKAEHYLSLYGFKVETLVRSGKASEVIYGVAKELGKTQVVLGAYGHSGISDFFFGSTAKKIVEDGHYPLFVYH